MEALKKFSEKFSGSFWSWSAAQGFPHGSIFLVGKGPRTPAEEKNMRLTPSKIRELVPSALEGVVVQGRGEKVPEIYIDFKDGSSLVLVASWV